MLLLSSEIERRIVTLSLTGRHFLKELDFSPAEWRGLLDLTAELKQSRRAGREVQRLSGMNLALIFEKTSTRTRSAFEVAAHHQGAHVTQMDGNSSQLGHKESPADTARVRRPPVDGRADRRALVRPGVERADRRVAPDAEPVRHVHHARGFRPGRS